MITENELRRLADGGTADAVVWPWLEVFRRSRCSARTMKKL